MKLKTAPLSPPDTYTYTYIHIRKVPTPYTQNYNFHDYNRKQHNKQTQEREHKNDDGLKLGYHHASRGDKLQFTEIEGI